MATLTGRLWGSADASRGIDTENETDDPEPITVDGTGATVTDAFDLEGGVTIAEAVHDGQGNFIVEPVPADDGIEDLPVNVIGDYDGAAGTIVEAGEYLLDIDADGNWELDLLQPRATEADAEPLPVELDGEGPSWAGPFGFEGQGEAHGTYDGQGNFIVELLPQDGRVPELVVTERDGVEGETMVDADGGFMTVEAAGPWTLTLESL